MVQKVKDRLELKSSDVEQGLKICIHVQFHILNWFRRVPVLRNQQKAVKCPKYTVKFAKTGITLKLIGFFRLKMVHGGTYGLCIHNWRAISFFKSDFWDMPQSIITHSIEHSSPSNSFFSLKISMHGKSDILNRFGRGKLWKPNRLLWNTAE